MRNAIFLTLTLMLVALIPGRASAEATFDPNADFSKYKTFAWVTDAPMLQSGSGKFRVPEEEVLRSIRATIEAKLQSVGLKKGASPDITVGFMVGVRDKAKTQHWSAPGANLPGYGENSWYGQYPRKSRSATHEYKEGELSVDIFDAKSKQAVWHNWASTKVYAQEKISTQEVVEEVVTEIFDGFPPRK